MPATSQQQQKLFGLALSVKRGETSRSEASDEVLNIVDTMSEKDIEDFASTSHSGLPKKVESIIRGFVRETLREKVLSEAPTRRSKDFFEDDNKYGIALHKLMRGKWDRNKALQYFIKLQSEKKDSSNIKNPNEKYQNILYFIATGLGINGRYYTSIVDLRDDIITAAENLYKIHNESVTESNQRSRNFFTVNTHGANLLKLLNGKWDREKVEKYFDNVIKAAGTKSSTGWFSDMKWTADAVGVDPYPLKNNKERLVSNIIDSIEKLYKTHNESIVLNNKKIKVSDSDLKDTSKIVKLIQKANPKVGSGFDEIDINNSNIRLVPYNGHSGFEYDIVSEEQEQLDEKLITFSNRAPYGQVVFIAGGAGSGKGFAIENFIDSAGYKVRDVDEMKKQIQKLNAIGKLSIQQIIDKFGRNIAPKDMDIIKQIQDDGYDLKSMNLKNPNHVYALHILVDSMGIKDKTLENMLAAKSNPETLPNIIFDITAKKITSITEVLPMLHSVGYKPNNIHLVWILTDYDIAIKQNAERSRVVPADIMLDTHIGAGNTVWGMVTSALPKGMNGRVDVILNNQQNTVFFIQRTTDKKTGQKKAVVSGFLALPVKKQGGPILPEKLWKDTLYNWIKDNGPKELTANFS